MASIVVGAATLRIADFRASESTTAYQSYLQ